MLRNPFGAGPMVSAVLTLSIAGAAPAAILFQDSFEGDTIDALPVADIGSYNTTHSNGRVIAYGAAATSPTPAAPNNVFPAAPSGGGSQGLRLQPVSGGGRDAALLSTPATGAGNLFHMEFYLYASSSVSFGFGSQIEGEAGITAGLNPSSTRPHQSVQINLAGGTIAINKDADNDPTTTNTFVATGLTFTANTFEKYEIDYVIGANQITFTAGAQTPLVINAPFMSATDSDFNSGNGLNPVTVSSLSQIDTLFFSTGSAGSVGFADQVVATLIPEPGTIGSLALMSLLATRRHRGQASPGRERTFGRLLPDA